jgi:hypothetical protein
MAGRQWGLLCPDGHGLLADRPEWAEKGVIWCGHEDHGGNGRFWRSAEVEEGWFDPSAPIRKTQAQLEREEHARQRAAEANAIREEREARQRKERRMTTDTTGTTKAPKAKDPRDCLCGCGMQTKGGRFIPGHDARFHGRIRKLEAAGLSHDEAEKVASQGQAAFDAAYTPIAPKPAPKATKAADPTDTATRAADAGIGVPKPTSSKRSRKERATSAPTEAEAEEADIPLG